MAPYGDLKVNNLIFDTGSGDSTKTVSGIPTASDLNAKASLTGAVFTGNISLNTQSTIQFKDSDSSHYVALQSPATVGTNITFKLPATDGTTGQFIKTDGSGNLSFATVDTSTLMPKAGGAFTGAVTSNNTISDSKGNLRSIPSNAQSSAHVATAADAGKAIYISSGGVTINNSVFSAGDAVTIINNSGSDQTITQGSGLTIYNTADASSGNRTLAGRGMCTLWFADASTAYVSGAGLS